MLYSHGTTLLKGNTIARSSAIFSGDLVQTNSDSVANINATGSSVLVLNESLVQYEGSTLNLEHGGVSVSTSKLLTTRAGGVTVSPASGAWTEFEVRGVDGRVQIAARTGDVTISHEKGTTTLAQGSSFSRRLSVGRQEKEPQASCRRDSTLGSGSQFALGRRNGWGIILGGTIWVLAKDDGPASPSR